MTNSNGRNTLWAGLSLLAALSLVLGVIATSGLHLPGEKGRGQLSIGVPDDAGAMVVNYLVNHGYALSVSTVEAYPIKDCCSSTSEWALASRRVDLAVLCPDAARRLVEKDRRYQIIGPCLVNGDMILLRPGASSPHRIGIAQNREYQREEVARALGENVTVHPMLRNALPYALEQGVVDGIVIDVLRGASLSGKRVLIAAGEEQVSYVLVVRRDLIGTPAFTGLMSAWGKAAAELQNPEQLGEAIQAATDRVSVEQEVMAWQEMKTRVVCPWK